MVAAISTLGLIEGRKALNWQLALKFVIGWLATVVVAALLVCGVFCSHIHVQFYTYPCATQPYPNTPIPQHIFLFSFYPPPPPPQAALLTAQGIYAPSKNCLDDLYNFHVAAVDMGTNHLDQVTDVNNAWSVWGLYNATLAKEVEVGCFGGGECWYWCVFFGGGLAVGVVFWSFHIHAHPCTSMYIHSSHSSP